MRRSIPPLVVLVLLSVMASHAGANFAGRPGAIAYADAHGIHLLDPRTGSSRLLSRDGVTPALFPDSRRFAYVRGAGIASAPGSHGIRYSLHQIFVKPVAEGPSAPGRGLFGPKTFEPGELSVSPDGRRILFAARRGFGPGNRHGQEQEIWSASISGGELRRLTRNRVKDADPEVSPDGRHVAFVRKVKGRGQIFVMDVDGSRQRRLTFDGRRDRMPNWSPDGGRLVYFEQMITGDGHSERSRELFTISATGGRPRRLTHDRVEEAYPVYSPDGRHIAFVGDLSVWDMPSDGGPARRLTEVEPAGPGPPDWGTAP